MKKIDIVIVVILNCLCFELSAIVGTETLASKMIGMNQEGYRSSDIVAALVFCVLSVAAMNVLNRWYDRAAGYAGKKRFLGRWARNEILVGLLTVYILVVFYIDEHQESILISELNLTWIEMLGFAAVGLAVFLYAMTYHKTKDVGVKIRDLMYANTTTYRRRYTLLIEEIIKSEEEFVVCGYVHGEIKSGDEVYLLSPKGPITKIRVKQLTVNDRACHSVKNDRTAVTFYGLKEPIEIPKYTAVSSVASYCSKITDGVNNVENPYLCAVLMEYTNLHQDRNYIGLLYYSICHANYLVAGTVQNKKMVGDIMDVPENRTDIGFSSVSQSGHTEPLLPAFTDWSALKNWKDIVNGEKSITLVVDFPHLVDILKNGFAGLVIDPFGPRPYALTLPMVEEITSSKGYREDFVLPKTERNS